MASIKILLYTSKKLKDGRHPIAVRLIHNRQVKYIFTNYSASIKEWDGNYPGFLNKNHPLNYRLNQHLIKLHTRANDQLIKLKEKEKAFSVGDWHSRILPQESKMTLYKYTGDLISGMWKAGKYGNADCYKTCFR